MDEYAFYHLATQGDVESIKQQGLLPSEDGVGGPGVYIWAVKCTEKAHKAFLYQLYDFIYEYKLQSIGLADDKDYVDDHLEELFSLFDIHHDAIDSITDLYGDEFDPHQDVEEAILHEAIPVKYVNRIPTWEKLLLPLDGASDKLFNQVYKSFEGYPDNYNQGWR